MSSVAADPFDPVHDGLYADWADTHDYDPRWDYSDELRPHWQQHQLVQAAQTRLQQYAPGGRVFAADLAPRNVVGIYAFGTGTEHPAILVDPYMHEQHTQSSDEAHAQMMRTVDHEYRHAQQEEEAGGHPNWDEDDAENGIPKAGAAPIAADFVQLLPTRVAHGEKDPRPVYFLWTFDPTDGKVYLDHNEDKHPADHITHDELAPHVTHPQAVHGFAYSIKGGYRITNDDHDEVDDPFIVRRVLGALAGQEPPAPLPHIRYHGNPA